MTANQTVDVQGLVEDGHLDLDAVFGQADWENEDGITTYTACVYGRDGDEPGCVRIVLQSATEYGITAYRWAERDDSGTHDHGPITLNQDEAIEGGEKYALDNDEEPDADGLIQQIVETGYFGAAAADDIWAICKTATEHSQGYLLLPAGEFCGHPIGRMWTTNGYLQCNQYVTLDATYPSIAYAADALLRAVTSSVSDED